MKIKEVINKFIDNSDIDEDYSLNLHYSKIQMNPQLLKRKYEEEQFKKYNINKEKINELI